MESSVERIFKLIQMNNDIPAHILKKLDINPSALSGWKSGKGRPSPDAIIKFASYYGVTTDYLLLGVTQNTDTFSCEETQLIMKYRELSLDGKNKLIERIRELEILGYINSNTKEEINK